MTNRRPPEQIKISIREGGYRHVADLATLCGLLGEGGFEILGTATANGAVITAKVPEERAYLTVTLPPLSYMGGLACKGELENIFDELLTTDCDLDSVLEIYEHLQDEGFDAKFVEPTGNLLVEELRTW